jgi:hypothetical protein
MVNVAEIEGGILRHDAVRTLPERFVGGEPLTLGRGQALDVHRAGA